MECFVIFVMAWCWCNATESKPQNVGDNISAEEEKKPKMKSKIDITEFRNRLKDNTKIGSPKLKIPLGFFSIFTDNSKCFYGRFDNSTFEIIKNSSFVPSLYFLKGTYEKTEKSLTVNYSLEPVGKLRLVWVKYFPIIALIMFNSIFYFQVKPSMKVYLIFNLFIIFISIVSKLNIKWQNRNLKRKFNKIFELTE
ncbi:hypothetical protein [Flavobacterium celericrescens]|uniref:Uncharacterized protein n=1 Tax=Flavobacterium celericrescens TaxID=2709780 RepID=A0ABX0I936_9FLAO|nr:hypothetical protein [Flavobacterium celericrescens]NHM03699.1 hypothetical protein [Flavobacterium celericrescens]